MQTDSIIAKPDSQLTSLATLAEQINHHHGLATEAAGECLSHVYQAGELLLQAKDLCKHGQWLPWLAEHFPACERTAQYYMDMGGDLQYMVELHPDPANPGYYYLLFNRDLDTESADVVYDKRGCKYDRALLAYVLQHIHGIKPTFWTEQPATGKLPCPVALDKAGSKPGRMHHAYGSAEAQR